MENNAIKAQTVSLVARLASKFGVEPGKLMACLMNQVFKQSDGVAPSNEELMVLLLVCENFGLNPFNREIFAFRGKGGDVIPVVSLDGWCKIVRNQKDFNGMSFKFSESTIKLNCCGGELPEYVECSIKLKGVEDPVTIQEYMVECFNEKSSVWRKWPRRMLRTRGFIQCARLAFSLTGIYDEGDTFGEDSFNGSGTTSDLKSQIPLVQQIPARPSLEKSRLDALIGKLIEHAKNRDDGWERAFQWIEEKFSQEDCAYAKEVLTAKRKELSLSSLPERNEILPEETSPAALQGVSNEDR